MGSVARAAAAAAATAAAPATGEDRLAVDAATGSAVLGRGGAEGRPRLAIACAACLIPRLVLRPHAACRGVTTVPVATVHPRLLRRAGGGSRAPPPR